MKAYLTAELIASLFILLFSYTAIHKFVSSDQFTAVLNQVLNDTGAAAIAFLTPMFESVVVLLLFFRRSRLIGLYASVGLLVLFTLYLVYMMLTVPHLPCSCGGVINKLGWKGHLVFNAVLIGLGVLGIRSQKSGDRRKKVSRSVGH